MKQRHVALRNVVASLVVIALLAQAIVPAARPEPILAATLAQKEDPDALYRTEVRLQHPMDQKEIVELVTEVLVQEEDSAIVVVDAEQLADLARLGFRPTGTDALARMGFGESSLKWSADRAALAVTESTDTDGDGLTDTEELWWCTDPNGPDSDFDLVSDGVEVSQLLAGNQSNGKPFLGWPPTITNCFDDDFDSVPDLVETNVVGLSINRESSDLDKYDDGQEFFGSTYCPGGPGSCGYGALPRTEDLYLGSNMPSFVEPPGDSPWVAAFPDPAVVIVDGSLSVESVTVVTTDHTIGNGESHTYSTATTKGTSTTNVDLETWNDWQEIDSGSGMTSTHPIQVGRRFNSNVESGGLGKLLKVGAGVAVSALAVHGLIGLGTAICSLTPPCAVAVAVGIVAIAVFEAVHIVDVLYESPAVDGGTTMDERNEVMDPNGCSGTAQANPLDTSGPLTCAPDNLTIPDPQDGNEPFTKHVEEQDRSTSSGGTEYYENTNGNVGGDVVHDGTVPQDVPNLSPLENVIGSRESGGIKGTTTTEYSETTITEAEEFSNFESWSEATAVDSAHAADLRFSYAILNDGTDIMRVLDGLLFDIYLGDDPNPIHTYNVIDQTGNLANIQPGQEVTFASDPVPLSLQQMAKIDQGSQLYITVELLSYGGDQLFFEDALNGGLIVGIEDGWADGDDIMDLYLMPCFGNPCGVDPTETLQTVIQRGFPTTEDDNGNLLSITTPEVNGPIVEWVEHSLAYNSWWNFYLSENLSYTSGFSSTLPLPGEAVVMRFLDDTDLDGFNDRTEERLGTDPDDPASHPTPELIAGTVSKRSGMDVAVTMAFLNTGVYDAAGVEVVAYAPDDTITINDNTIGGSGRVPSGSQVTVSSRIGRPDLTGWTGSAMPSTGGLFTGSTDADYTLTAAAAGEVGNSSLVLNWTDGTNNGTLQVGSGYLSPLPLPVGNEGVSVSFNSGTVSAGESFTFRARPAGDTIRYTINQEPYTPPTFVVSYNDPQGNHRFITPVTVTSVISDLLPYSGQMLEDLSFDITTLEPFDETMTNTMHLIVNSPHPATIEDAHLFVEHINISGTVVAEQVFTTTLLPGPTVLPVPFDTAIYSEPFSGPEDYTILALWTDSQGNIIDTTVRPLASFQEDPIAIAAETPVTWDFGVVYQGEPVYEAFILANIGRYFMRSKIDTDLSNVSILGQVESEMTPADSLEFGLLVDTAEAGLVSGDVTIRSTDPTQPLITISVSGTIKPLPNLIVQDDDISFSDDLPSPGNSITISATVHNTGTVPAENVVVRFYSGDQLAGGVEIGSDIVNIAAGSQAVANVAWTYAAGENFIHVVADAEQIVPETDENDNDGRAFLNLLTTIPPDGVLDSGLAYLITDSVQLTSSIVVTDGALLVIRDVTDSLDALSIGAEAVLALYATNLNVGSLDTDGVLSATMVLLDEGASFTSQTVLAVRARRVLLRNATLTSSGQDSPGTGNGFQGYVLIAGDRLFLDQTMIVATGGTGGSGSYQAGGRGGAAGIDLFASTSATLLSTSLGAHAGSGGPGYSQSGPGTNEGFDGGDGGAAALAVLTPVYVSDATLISITGGIGGEGGAAAERGNGGDGGAGGAAALALHSDYTLIKGGSINVRGQGGMVGHAGGCCENAAGGSGGNGGDGSLIISATVESAIAEQTLLSVTGGDGGDGNTGSVLGGKGGDGGLSTLSVASEAVNIDEADFESKGGSAGNGGYASAGTGRNCSGGTGGDGGGAVLDIASQASGTKMLDSSLLAGDGGNGGNTGTCYANYGGPAGDGATVQLAWEATTTWLSAQTTWSLMHGVAGVPGGGGSGGAAGLDGLKLVEILDGYDGSIAAGARFVASEITPNFFTVADVFSVTIGWNGGISETLVAPYESIALINQGFNWLDLNHHFTDTTVLNSHHRLYLYGVPIDYDLDGLLDRDEAEIHGSDPTLSDTDADGLDDGVEITNGSDPRNPDSDYDGVLDGNDPDSLTIPDLQPGIGGIALSDAAPTEGGEVTITLPVENMGAHSARGVVVSFFAGDPADAGRYLCADFIPLIPIGATQAASCVWSTANVTGTHEIHLLIDPLNNIAEENETNNNVSALITIRTRPDLRVASILPLPAEAAVSETVTITAILSNTGQTESGMQQVALYDDGILVSTIPANVPALSSIVVALPWSPATAGGHMLRVVADDTNVVAEPRELNNDATASGYAGFFTPLTIDNGGATDPPYTPVLGYGYLTEGTVRDCGGAEPYETYRQNPSGNQLLYQYDHLLPGRFYHLDLTFFLCSGSRELRVLVDGVELAGGITANAIEPAYASLVLDPLAYADHQIVVTIESDDIGGPAIAELALHEIRYCYRDSGVPGEVAYAGAPDGCGWLDGYGFQGWGNLPEETVRFDDDGLVQYRFDGLSLGKLYDLALTFYKGDGANRVQDVLVDGVPVLSGIVLSNTPQRLTVDVPVAAYADGSIVVGISAPAQPVISEIALEEVTVIGGGPPPTPTPTPSPTPIPGGATVGIGAYSVAFGRQVTTTVNAAAVPAPGLGAATILLHYDNTVLSVAGCLPDPDGLFDSAICNLNHDADTVAFTYVSTAGITGDFPLAHVAFDGAGASGSNSPLDLEIDTFVDPAAALLQVSDVDGNVTIGLLGDASCDDARNVIDALYAMQYDVGLRSAAGSCPLLPDTLNLNLCDVTGDADCNVIDALFIMQCDVGIPNPLCPLGGSILPPAPAAPTQPVLLRAGSGELDGDTLTVPLTADLPVGLAALAGTLEISYDPAVVTAVDCALAAPFTGSCHATFDANGLAPDRLRLSLVDVAPTAGEFTLAEMTFAARGNGVTMLQPEVALLSDGWNMIPAQVESGELVVSGVTAVTLSRFADGGDPLGRALGLSLAALMVLPALWWFSRRRREQPDG